MSPLERIFRYVVKHPGCFYRDVRAAGLVRDSEASRLAALCKHGLLRRERMFHPHAKRKMFAYFPVVETTDFFLSNPEKLIKFVTKNPGCIYRDVLAARVVPCAEGAHLKALCDEGLLRRELVSVKHTKKEVYAYYPKEVKK